jgi:hypothetical protein
VIFIYAMKAVPKAVAYVRSVRERREAEGGDRGVAGDGGTEGRD